MIDAAVAQMTAAIETQVDRLTMYGLVERTRDPASLAEVTVAELAAIDEDRKIAAEASQTVMELLWLTHDPPDEWWETPLGRLVMRAGPPGVDRLSISETMAVLGLSRPRVNQLIDDGVLERVARGRVSADSVRALLDDRSRSA